jgi:hypothetical protein
MQVTAHAGWFAPLMLNAAADDSPPPYLQASRAPDSDLSTQSRSIFEALGWTPDEVVGRQVTLQSGEFNIRPGGELWLRVDDIVERLAGSYHAITPVEPASSPHMRVIWFKGGRIQLAHDLRIPTAYEAPQFEVSSSGPRGWIAFLVSPTEDGPEIRLRFSSAGHIQE